MFWRIRQFAAVARISLLDIIRQPGFLLIAAAGMALITLLPLLLTQTLGESARLVRDNALAVHWTFGLVLGSYAASSTLARETALGTAALVLSKPVSRSLFFLAKFCGAAAATLLFSLGAGMATLLSARMAAGYFILDWRAGGPAIAAPVLAFLIGGYLNYRDRGPFASRAFIGMLVLYAAALAWACAIDAEGHCGAFGAAMDWRLAPAGLLIAMALLMLTGLAGLLATRLDTVPTLILCSLAFLLGLMSDHLFGRATEPSAAVSVLGGLLPNWQHFWLADALSGNGQIPWSYVGHASAYGAMHLGGLLLLGLLSFRRAEWRNG